MQTGEGVPGGGQHAQCGPRSAAWEPRLVSWVGPAVSLRAGCWALGFGGECRSGVVPQGCGLAVSPGTSALCPHSRQGTV